MSWRVTLRCPNRPAETSHYQWPRDAWAGFHEIVRNLENDGFVAGELETIRYGTSWAQHLLSDTGSCRIEMTADEGSM